MEFTRAALTHRRREHHRTTRAELQPGVLGSLPSEGLEPRPALDSKRSSGNDLSATKYPPRFRSESPDSGGKNSRKLSTRFLAIHRYDTGVVAMGVLMKTGRTSDTDGEYLQYVCLSCGTGFEVQHHVCPVCESFDVRYSKWVQE